MARYVLDAQTLLHLVDHHVPLNQQHQLVVPAGARSEVLQLLLGEVRSGKRIERAALEAHQQITVLKMRVLGDRVSRGTAWRLAVEHHLSSIRDAEYLALTMLQADALVTVDPDLAAQAAEVVRVAPLEVLFHR